MDKPVVYLAGPIANTDYSHAVDWREAAIVDLFEYHITGLSPMRAKRELLAHGDRIAGNFRTYQKLGPFFTSGGIMMRDHADVHRSDALLVNLLGTKSPSYGTAMELAWAFHAHIPIVAAIEEGNVHLAHPMVAAAIGSLRYATLKGATHAVAVVCGRAS